MTNATLAITPAEALAEVNRQARAIAHAALEHDVTPEMLDNFRIAEQRHNDAGCAMCGASKVGVL